MLLDKPSSNVEFLGGAGRVRGLPETIRSGLDALFTGARTVPMGDNGALLRELGRRSARAWPTALARATDR